MAYELIWTNDSNVIIEITIDAYIKFQRLYKSDISNFLPEPLIEFISKPGNIIFVDRPNYKLEYIVRVTFMYQQCNNISLITQLFADIKSNINTFSSPHMTIFLEKNGRAYLNPFEISDFNIDNIWDINDTSFDGTYWSAAHKQNKNIIDLHEIATHSYAKYPKYDIRNIFSQTSVLKQYTISEYSITKLKQYPNLIYKFQDGHTQIWMNNDIVVKLSFMRILAEHEISILKLRIDVLPEMIESWNSNDEYIIVMKNCGNPPNDIYGFSCLIPESIIEQQNSIVNKLNKLGLKHLDDHACNYVLADNKLTMIDCEVIVDIDEYNKYKLEPNYKPVKYPLEYYEKINKFS